MNVKDDPIKKSFYDCDNDPGGMAFGARLISENYYYQWKFKITNHAESMNEHEFIDIGIIENQDKEFTRNGAWSQHEAGHYCFCCNDNGTSSLSAKYPYIDNTIYTWKQPPLQSGSTISMILEGNKIYWSYQNTMTISLKIDTSKTYKCAVFMKTTKECRCELIAAEFMEQNE